MQARTRRMSLLAGVAITLMVVLAGPMLAQSSRPTNVGFWTLDVAKSKVAADRKTMTITGTGTNPLGQTVNSVALYVRRNLG